MTLEVKGQNIGFFSLAFYCLDFGLQIWVLNIQWGSFTLLKVGVVSFDFWYWKSAFGTGRELGIPLSPVGDRLLPKLRLFS